MPLSGRIGAPTRARGKCRQMLNLSEQKGLFGN